MCSVQCSSSHLLSSIAQLCAMARLCVFALLALVAAVSAQDSYSTKYDNVDLDEILRSDRLLNNYFKCLMESGPCTPDAQELRKNLPDALQNKCSKCTPKQQEGTERVVRFLIENHPKEFLELERKYDPQGNYRKEYQPEADKRGIKLPEPLPQ